MLHYFLDLAPLFALAHRLLRPAAGAALIVRDFHPVSTKLLTKPGQSKKWKLTGSYFDGALAPSAVAYSKMGGGGSESESDGSGGSSGGGAARGGAGGGGGGGGDKAPTTLLRRWTLGEVVTAAAGAGLVVARLEEEPGVRGGDAGIPKLFTLVATRP